MVALGVGVMVILAIGLLEHALVRQVGENRTSIRRPFFIDIQPDQAAAFCWAGSSTNRRCRAGLDAGPLAVPCHRRSVVTLDRESETGGGANQSREGKAQELVCGIGEYVLTFLDDVPKRTGSYEARGGDRVKSVRPQGPSRRKRRRALWNRCQVCCRSEYPGNYHSGREGAFKSRAKFRPPFTIDQHLRVLLMVRR